MQRRLRGLLKQNFNNIFSARRFIGAFCPALHKAATLVVIIKRRQCKNTFFRTRQNIIDCYDKTAKNYADKFQDELSHKHLDRILLKSFATENHGIGKLIDLGCGPGQTTKYLSDCGLTDILGVDISSKMVTVAKEINLLSGHGGQQPTLKVATQKK